MDSLKSNERPLTELTSMSRLVRFAAIGVIMAAIVGLFAYASGWLTPHKLTPTSLINTFEKVNGVHAGFRRNHAKGLCFSGYFESNGNGVALSQAAIFPAGRLPIVGRFSLAGGRPFQTDEPQTTRGMAVLFQMPDGEEWRTAMINMPVFPVRTADGFRDQLVAAAPDPTTGKPDPSKVKAFLAKYPESAKAAQIIGKRPISSGFDNSTFNGLNAFRFINANGVVTAVRWSMVPVQAFEAFDAMNHDEVDKNYLFDALITAIHSHPLQWHLIVTIGQPGDPTNDATIPWPPERQQVDVGTLTVDRVDSDDTSPARDINFDPLVLPNGIKASDDPLLSPRSAAYSQSFTRREGETKSPAAVSNAESKQ